MCSNNVFCYIVVDRPYAAEVRDYLMKNRIWYDRMFVPYRNAEVKYLHVHGDEDVIINACANNEHIKDIKVIA